MMPENLPSFLGWRPVGWEEAAVATDVLVVWQCTMGYDPNQRHPDTTPSNFSTHGSWIGLTPADLIDKSRLNRHFYPYRRVTYKGMPEGIKGEPGWFPLPDNEPMKPGDRWYYSIKFTSAYDEANEECEGKSAIQWAKLKKIDEYGGWPYRYGSSFSGAPEPRRNRLPPNPAKLTQPLPLP